MLIRDAAYEALPKTVRADLHAHFADWLDDHGHALVERDEIVGYHLEQSTRYRAELGRPDSALAERAASRLAAAGRRARERSDQRAALVLLSRAAELTRPLRFDLALELEAAWAIEVVDVHGAARAAGAVATRADAAGDRSGAMIARALGLFLLSYSGDLYAYDEQEALCRSALQGEEQRGDPRRLALLWSLLAISVDFQGLDDEAVDASERALNYFRLGGDSPAYTVPVDWALIKGPRPADEALRTLDGLAVGWPPGSLDLGRAVLLAMLGRIEEAWPIAEARSDHLREVTRRSGAGLHYLAAIAMVEGDRERACRHHAELIESFPPGSDGLASSWRLLLALDLCYLGRPEEAEPLLRLARAVPPGPFERALIPAVEALVLAARGELERAEALARAGIPVAEGETENRWVQGWCHEALATVLERAGRIDEAREELERARAAWEQKRCLPYVRRLGEQIVSLGRAKL